MITEWDKLSNRVKLEVSKKVSNGRDSTKTLIAVNIALLVDCDGNPLVWTISSDSVEPLSKAKTLLELYSSL